MAKFEFQLDPIDGESLNGYIVRASAENCYTSSEVFDWIETTTRSRSRLDHDRTGIHAVHQLTGLTHQKIREMQWQNLPGLQPPPLSEKTPSPDLARGGLDRFSPKALAASEHHRLLWDATFLVADCETGELLYSRCPGCNKRLCLLGRTMTHCSRCHFDLRQAESCYASLTVFEVNLALAKMCNSNARIRQAPVSRLPAPVQHLNITELIALLALLSELFRTYVRDESPGKFHPLERQIVPFVFGFEMLADWPARIAPIFEQIAKSMNNGHLTSATAFSDITKICNLTPHPAVRTLLYEVAGDILGVPSHLLRLPEYERREEVGAF